MPLNAYVSKKTCVASTDKHKASSEFAARSVISLLLVFTAVEVRGELVCGLTSKLSRERRLGTEGPE
jgi:uncharacterized membrane protein (DUF4010 family)